MEFWKYETSFDDSNSTSAEIEFSKEQLAHLTKVFRAYDHGFGFIDCKQLHLCVNNLSCLRGMNGIFDEPLLDSEYNYIVQNYADNGRINFDNYLVAMARRFRGQSRRASINSTNQSSLSRNSSSIDDPEVAYKRAFKEFDFDDTGFITADRLQLGMLNYKK